MSPAQGFNFGVSIGQFEVSSGITVEAIDKRYGEVVVRNTHSDGTLRGIRDEKLSMRECTIEDIAPASIKTEGHDAPDEV